MKIKRSLCRLSSIHFFLSCISTLALLIYFVLVSFRSHKETTTVVLTTTELTSVQQ